MRYVWLLWGSEGGITETPWIEGVYADKVKAEADLRLLKTEATMGDIYWIQEKQVTTLKLKESNDANETV